MATELNTVPRDAYLQEEALSLKADTAKSPIPNCKNSFGHAAGGSARIAQTFGINPQDPIALPEEHKPQQQVDPQQLNVQAQCGGAFLQECHVGPKADSFFGACCTEVTNDIQEVAQCLQGKPAIQSQDLALNQKLQMDYAPRPSMGGLF